MYGVRDFWKNYSHNIHLWWCFFTPFLPLGLALGPFFLRWAFLRSAFFLRFAHISNSWSNFANSSNNSLFSNIIKLAHELNAHGNLLNSFLTLSIPTPIYPPPYTNTSTLKPMPPETSSKLWLSEKKDQQKTIIHIPMGIYNY